VNAVESDEEDQDDKSKRASSRKSHSVVSSVFGRAKTIFGFGDEDEDDSDEELEYDEDQKSRQERRAKRYQEILKEKGINVDLDEAIRQSRGGIRITHSV